MADVTGGTPPTNASPFAVPADIKKVYDHFGDPGKYKVASVASLPATGNWVGRQLFVEDVAVTYVCASLPNGWRRTSTYAQIKGVTSCAASGVTNVTFSPAFSTVPVLDASVVNNAVVSVAHITNLTATGMEVRVFDHAGTQRAGVVHWTASQATALSATG